MTLNPHCHAPCSQDLHAKRHQLVPESYASKEAIDRLSEH